MGIFKPSLDKQLTDAVTARDRLISRLAEIETNIADLKAEAERCALDNLPDAELDKVEIRIRAATDRASTLRSALSKADASVADLSAARDASLDKAQREKTASQIELLARECAESGAEFAASADRFYSVMVRAAPCGAMEANGLANFAEVARREVPDGSSLVARLLREHRARVLDGSGPAIMKQPDAAPYVEAIPAKEPTAMLFALRPIKWRDEFGKLRMGGKFQDCELPQRLAAKALQSGAVVSLDNPLRRQHVSQGGPVPRADTAFDLDETPPPEPERPSGELHSAVVEFQQINRGPPRLMQVAR